MFSATAIVEPPYLTRSHSALASEIAGARLTKILTKTTQLPTATDDIRALNKLGCFGFAAANGGPQRPASEPVKGL